MPSPAAGAQAFPLESGSAEAGRLGPEGRGRGAISNNVFLFFLLSRRRRREVRPRAPEASHHSAPPLPESLEGGLPPLPALQRRPGQRLAPRRLPGSVREAGLSLARVPAQWDIQKHDVSVSKKP